jgi:hypothetical protein
MFLFDFNFTMRINLKPIIQVNKPVAFPCFGVSTNEKYVILPSVSDVVVEQGTSMHY